MIDIIPEEKLLVIKERILNDIEHNRLSCAKAHAIAKSLNVQVMDIGRIADHLHIKISNCQLGCF